MLLAPTVLSPLIVSAETDITAITTADTDADDLVRDPVVYETGPVDYEITYNGIEQAITGFTAGVAYVPVDASLGNVIARRSSAEEKVVVWNRVASHDAGNAQDTVYGRYYNTFSSMLSARNIFMGSENLFVNAVNPGDPETNVERVDYIFVAGLTARDEMGFAVFERGQNTAGSNGTFKIAAITGFDGGGLPTFTGSNIVTVAQNSYGTGILTTPTNFRYDIFRKDVPTDTELDVIPQNNINLGPQGVSGVLISSTELVSANTVIYGYAVFGADVSASDTQLADWMDDTNFPTDSAFSNDMDLVATGAIAYASSLTISGNVFDDTDGLTDGTVDGTGTDTGVDGPLYAILVDTGGDVVDCVPVSPTGVFILGGAQPSTTYTVILSTTSETAGNAAPSPSVPVGWTNTGEHLGANAGDDGTVDGSLEVAIVDSNVSDANFGIQEASFTVEKSVDPTSVSSTGDVTYTVVLTNTCDGPLTGVTINDSLEPDVTPGTAVESMTDDDILEVGETWTWTYTYTITQPMLDAGTSIDNIATVDTDQTDADTDDATVDIVQGPSMSLVKTGTVDMSVVPPIGQANPGDEIHYVFTVTNTGNVTLTNIVVTDPKVTVMGGPIASLAPGASDSSLTGTYVLTPADIGAGVVPNTATATSPIPGASEVTAIGESFTRLLPNAVGGEAYPVNKVGLMAPWMVLIAAVTAGGLYLRRVHDVK